VIRELRIYWRLRPIIKQAKELSNMKLSVNVVIQLLALVAQAINATQDLLPPKGKFWAMVILSVVQGISAVLAHFANPDGTPVTEPYAKK